MRLAQNSRTFCEVYFWPGAGRILRLIPLGALLLELFPRCAAQGLIWFNNKVGGGGVDAPVLLQGTLEGPGPAFSAQLYISDGGSLTPLTPATVFRERGVGAAAIASRYVVPVEVMVPSLPSGAPAILVMKAWNTSLGTFDDAVRAGYYYGQSSPFEIN